MHYRDEKALVFPEDGEWCVYALLYGNGIMVWMPFVENPTCFIMDGALWLLDYCIVKLAYGVFYAPEAQALLISFP